MRNLKRIIALIAVFALTVTTVAFASNYSDVKDDSQYAEAVATLSKLNIFTGDDQNGDGVMEFRPDDSVTRAEFSTLIARIKGFEGTAMSGAATVFNDVPSSHWASGYIAQAYGQGVINGYGDGNFGPEDNVKYEDAIKMIMVTLGYAPYANDNGGYPTGYLTAAQRYEVTDGVSNGVVGQAATRGTIAQLLNNAIDTPIMEQSKWSNNGVTEYVVYDGTDYAYKTLMSEYLKVTKLKGQVTSNSITTFDTYQTIDTSNDAEVTIDVNGNYETSNDDYDTLEEYTFKVGDTDAEDYLGQQVVFYVKDDDSTDNDTIVSIAPETGKNDTVSFTLDKYDSATVEGSGDDSYLTSIKYMKNDTDSNATKLTVEDNAVIFYNNVAGTMNAENLFDAEDGLIKEDSAFSGQIKLVDANSTSGYDVIFVEVSASAVVDEVEDDTISFKTAAGYDGYNNEIDEIIFDDDDTDVICKITKDGKEISKSDLQEWDVLSIITNTALDNVYDITVISNAIEGKITATTSSDTSETGTAYKINGTKYDAAVASYETNSLEVGDAGMFYIDAYGKIAAYNKDATASSSSSSYNFAYIFDLAQDEDGFGNETLKVKMLTAEYGTVVLATDDKLTVKVPKSVVYDSSSETYIDVDGDGKLDSDCELEYNIDVDGTDGVYNFLSDVKVVAYKLNSSDEITEITLPGAEGEDLKLIKGADTSSEYNLDNQKLGGKKVEDDTVVLFVDTADDDNCSVGTVDGLSDGEKYYVDLYSDDSSTSTTAALAVAYNADNVFAASSSMAVISGVYNSVNDNDDEILTIEYYMDGDSEAKSANTTVDLYDNGYDSETNKGIDQDTISKGDIYKFKFNAAGEITNAVPMIDFEDGVRDEVTSASVYGTPRYDNGGDGTYGTVSDGDNTEYIISGAVDTRYDKDAHCLTIDGIDYDLDDAENIYVYDPSLSEELGTGGVSAAKFISKLLPTDEYGSVIDVTKVVDDDGVTLYNGSTDINGLLPYIYFRVYEGNVTEALIVKPYEYDIDSVLTVDDQD